jgi:hypothetical protein
VKTKLILELIGALGVLCTAWASFAHWLAWHRKNKHMSQSEFRKRYKNMKP